MMSSAVGLFAAALLCFCSAAFGQAGADGQPGVLVFCDDPSVQKAVTSALHDFNSKLTVGQKLALFEVTVAKKTEDGSDSLYYLEFTSRRSDCPAGGSKNWTDCDYLPTGALAAISCNATVYVNEKVTFTKEVYCNIDGYISAEKAKCLGCPVEIEENSEDLKVPLVASVSKFNSISNSTHLFAINRVGHATRQVVAGFRYKLRFDMKKTTCAKAEHKDLNDLCVPDEDNKEFVNCNATVDMAPWRLEQPSVLLAECRSGALSLIRRRPPGWSPLRNLDAPSSHPSPSVPSPSKTPGKEESSEEDTTASKPSASPKANNHPFHCPTSPWKQFKPVQPVAPPDAAQASQKPPLEGDFSDTDLLS
ncbi:kininogen-1 [Poeciliopsis prolifica]|uniref:kininogen-1 n=1 Tax=Poeciliopsis prolifica TaxID=188132 RepID=UPI0024131F23|nr:kininogen-1 [Poeciliopsis prolifica]XP_054914420.1 kininogen-1 [Poeciliopsis prolifica]